MANPLLTPRSESSRRRLKVILRIVFVLRALHFVVVTKWSMTRSRAAYFSAYCILPDPGTVYDRCIGDHVMTFSVSGYT